MTTSLYLSPVLRFNKAIDSIYSHYPCEVDVKLRLCWHTVYILGLWIEIYVRIYVFLRETTLSCTLLDLYFWRENDFLMPTVLLLPLFLIPFGSYMIYLFIPFML